jgi:hypothetical protein
MEYRKFFAHLKEGVEKYLIWEPTGIYSRMAEELNKLVSQPGELYRAASDKEVFLIKRDKVFQSAGEGNTRENAGTYVAGDVHLAGAFAIRYYRDGLGGNVLVLDRNKLPEPVPRDPGNFTVDHIPLIAVKRIINLKNFVEG